MAKAMTLNTGDKVAPELLLVGPVELATQLGTVPVVPDLQAQVKAVADLVQTPLVPHPPLLVAHSLTPGGLVHAAVGVTRENPVRQEQMKASVVSVQSVVTVSPQPPFKVAHSLTGRVQGYPAAPALHVQVKEAAVSVHEPRPHPPLLVAHSFTRPLVAQGKSGGKPLKPDLHVQVCDCKLAKQEVVSTLPHPPLLVAQLFTATGAPTVAQLSLTRIAKEVPAERMLAQY